jgi:hypothetical protein
MPLINQPINATVTGSQGGVAWETAFDFFGKYYQFGTTPTNVMFERNNLSLGVPEFGVANNTEFLNIFDTPISNAVDTSSLYGQSVISPRVNLWAETGFDAICLAKFSIQVPASSPYGFIVSGTWGTDNPDGADLWAIGHTVEPGGYYESTTPVVVTSSSATSKYLSPQIIPTGLDATSSIRLTIAKYNLT